MNKTDFTLEAIAGQLRTEFLYKDGSLYWNVQRRGLKRGTRAGTAHNLGYRQIRINQVLFYEHRLVWLYHYGVMPEQIDHINGIRDDNRIENLRECTFSENHQNRALKRNSKTGVPGVTECQRGKRWQARIALNGKVQNLGFYDDIEDARAAYERAKSSLHNFNPEVVKRPAFQP